MVNGKRLITAASEIVDEGQTYVKGKDGSHGECDCIGLIIGALRRCGETWNGLHGSNYAARNEMEYMLPVVGSSDMIPGELVYKSHDPGQAKYDLPDRYQKGNSYYNGDLRDYYHVGIVISIYPLQILHMTSPKAFIDTRLGKWSWHGKLKKVILQAEDEGAKQMEDVIIGGGELSAPIHMRRAASTGSAIVADIPQGSTARLIEGGGVWNQIEWNKLQGWVMSKFVTRAGSEIQEETVTVNKKELEQAYDILGNLLGLRG